MAIASPITLRGTAGTGQLPRVDAQLGLGMGRSGSRALSCSATYRDRSGRQALRLVDPRQLGHLRLRRLGLPHGQRDRHHPQLVAAGTRVLGRPRGGRHGYDRLQLRDRLAGRRQAGRAR